MATKITISYLSGTDKDFVEVSRFRKWVESVRADQAYTFELPRNEAQRSFVSVRGQIDQAAHIVRDAAKEFDFALA